MGKISDKYKYKLANNYALLGFSFGVKTVLQKSRFCFYDNSPCPYIVVDVDSDEINCVQLDFNQEGIYVKSLCKLEAYSIDRMPIQNRIGEVERELVKYLTNNGGGSFLYERERKYVSKNYDSSAVFRLKTIEQRVDELTVGEHKLALDEWEGMSIDEQTKYRSMFNSKDSFEGAGNFYNSPDSFYNSPDSFYNRLDSYGNNTTGL